jgi:phosphoribosyl 1,2-cyclic phosphodiesterase
LWAIRAHVRSMQGPHKTQAQIQAAHTEIPHDPHNMDDELQDTDEVICPQDTDHESVYLNEGEEYVLVDIREYVQGNSHYEWDTDTEFLAPMTDRVMKPEGMIKAINNDGQKNGAVKV